MPVAGIEERRLDRRPSRRRPEEELQRVRIDAGLRIGDLRHDRGAAARESLRDDAHGRRPTSFTHERSVYRPAERAAVEQIASGVDGDVVATRREEDAAGGADRVEEVGKLAVDVHGDARVPEHVVLVEGAHEPWVDGLVRAQERAVIDAWSLVAGVTTTTPAFTACFVMSASRSSPCRRRSPTDRRRRCRGSRTARSATCTPARDPRPSACRRTASSSVPTTGAPVSDDRETENAYGIRRTSLPRRRRMKPKLSPWTPPAATRAVICMTAVPPGAMVTGAAVDRRAGGRDLRLHVGDPRSGPIARVGHGDGEGLRVRATACDEVAEGERLRVGEEQRLVGGADPHESGSLNEHRGLLRERRVGERGTGRGHECRLHLLRRPRRMALREKRRNACDVRRGEARPVENGVLVTGELGKRRREDLRSGSGHVRLERVAERRQPRRREARRDARPGRRHFERCRA